ncbi:conserved Plasmodium protein, unknown function [Plasmodium malariae]|uniref:DUF4200 domain-containing protein n=1 Tax=Plasmodium malariae TaxID=5858 RepID=A0A1C3KDV1_PLAMA|nr:conserved Plasmodium protein, unknown function [Plasmodium malariae]
MSEEDFYNNLETIIEESRRRIIDKERLLAGENCDKLKSSEEQSIEAPYYKYTSLIIPSYKSSENNSCTKKNKNQLSDNIKELLKLHEDKDIEVIKKKLEEKKISKKNLVEIRIGTPDHKTSASEYNRKIFKNINSKNKSNNDKRNKDKNILSNERWTKKNTSNIRDFINLEKEIFIARTLMYKKKTRLDDIYNYTSKKENIINNLSKNINKEAAKLQESLVENFKKTEELIKKFEEISSKKKKKKNQVQLLNIEISKLNVEFEKKDEKIKELDKYKNFLNKLANSDTSDENALNKKKAKKKEEQGEEIKEQKKEEDNFSKNMEKYIKNSQLLIDNFNMLEEQHLQLIDDTQNAEYELEEYEKKYEDKKKNMQIKNKEIDIKIKQVNTFIKEHNEKISEYENIIKNNQDQISFTNINNKIDYICTQFSYDINTNEIMKKLQILENKIYSYFTALTKYTEENSQLVYEYQREREQERRKQMRFEINLDRKGNNQNKQLKNKKVNNKNSAINLKDKKEKRENIYTLFEKDLFK